MPFQVPSLPASNDMAANDTCDISQRNIAGNGIPNVGSVCRVQNVEGFLLSRNIVPGYEVSHRLGGTDGVCHWLCQCVIQQCSV